MTSFSLAISGTIFMVGATFLASFNQRHTLETGSWSMEKSEFIYPKMLHR